MTIFAQLFRQRRIRIEAFMTLSFFLPGILSVCCDGSPLGLLPAALLLCDGAEHGHQPHRPCGRHATAAPQAASPLPAPCLRSANSLLKGHQPLRPCGRHAAAAPQAATPLPAPFLRSANSLLKGQSVEQGQQLHGTVLTLCSCSTRGHTASSILSQVIQQSVKGVVGIKDSLVHIKQQ
jgi:hypothetical protein